MEYKSCSTEETIKTGKEIAKKLKGGDIVLLRGDLGAGKTTLTKGIAEGFGIDEVVSPTFTLMQVYNIQTFKHLNIRTLAHIDTYRLDNQEQLVEVGVEDYLGDPETICLVEWPEKIEGLLKNKKTIEISIETVNDNERKIYLSE